jgi:peptidoglycan/xylan/chitin deacetylase (PgdA/CDA1 family)
MFRFLFIAVFMLTCCHSKSSSDTANVGFVDPKHHEKEVAVFVYHRFGNDKYPSTNISIENFEQHLSYLKSNNFVVLNFGEALDYINNPEIAYHHNVACITVDDGYKTFISNGLPLLKKYGFSATVFINSESVGGGTYMNWEELKQIHEQGIEIGNHSHSHAYFLNTAKSDRSQHFRKDVLKCQEEIKMHLGFYPDVFAYPYGEFDPEMKLELKSMGFKGAAAQNSGIMHHFDDFAIPRFPMAGPYVKLEGFMEKANIKALRIEKSLPGSFVLEGENPPNLIISIASKSADLSRLNCFISEGCDLKLAEMSVLITAQKPLSNRRTLYTITAPAKEGKGWYWFSHLWVQPEIPE